MDIPWFPLGLHLHSENVQLQHFASQPPILIPINDCILRQPLARASCLTSISFSRSMMRLALLLASSCRQTTWWLRSFRRVSMQAICLSLSDILWQISSILQVSVLLSSSSCVTSPSSSWLHRTPDIDVKHSACWSQGVTYRCRRMLYRSRFPKSVNILAKKSK